MKKPRILLVEDEQHLVFGIQFNLEREGYEVVVAADGNLADQILTEQAPLFDLVILDLMLPGLNGYDICARLRRAGGQMPVLMLSARSLPEDRQRGFEVGADQYLNKPFDLNELLSRVKSLLSRFSSLQNTGSPASSGAGSEPEILIGDKTVDFDTFEIRTGDQTIQTLTSLEAKLLRYFIENEGLIIPRSELLEMVWEVDIDSTSRAPDQFIRRLRKIFEVDPANPEFFLTVRDAGYRFGQKTAG